MATLHALLFFVVAIVLAIPLAIILLLIVGVLLPVLLVMVYIILYGRIPGFTWDDVDEFELFVTGIVCWILTIYVVGFGFNTPAKHGPDQLGVKNHLLH